MAFLQYPGTPSFIRPSFLSPKSPSLLINSIIFTKTPPKPHTKYISFPARPPPNALPTTDQEILDSITGSNGGSAIGEAEVKNLPSVRSYENDLARLTVIGDVRFEQALTAAAADGGDAAEEHIAYGMSTMVVETVFPGNSDERSTVSTRLFLPAKRVKEKARKLRSTLTADILSSTTSRNILAMTFRQVVLQHLWSFELAVFSPGTERNMEDLANPREVPACFTLSSSDGSVLSALAEAVCLCALESTETDFLESTQSMASYKMFRWFQKRKRTTSSDSSVHIYKIPQDQIVENAENLVENFNLVKGIYRLREKKPKDRWWASPTYSRLENIGGPEFSTWTNEYVPSYRLQIDADKFENVKFVGWQKSPDNRWEVLLTHFQMVGLAKILDLYYEDLYTLPNKQLSSGLVSEISKLSKSKRSSSLLRMLSITFAGGCFLVAIGILAQLCKPHLFKARKSPAEHYVISSSEIDGCQYQSVEAPEVKGFASHSLCSKLRLLKGKLKHWHQSELCKREAEMDSILSELQALDACAEEDSMSSELLARRIQLIQNLSNRVLQNEISWRQKSRSKWIKEGDKNTRYFHSIGSMHAKANKLSSITVNDVRIDDKDEISEQAISYFRGLLQDRTWDEPLLDLLQFDSISDHYALLLKAPFSLEEVKALVGSLGGDKAPGPAGYPILFFQKCWDFIQEDVLDFFKEFHDRGKLLKSLGASFIALIRKFLGAASFGHFRTISLLGGPYKILAKVLASRLKKVMGSIISPNQCAFILGRQIIDRALIANECLHSSHSSSKKSIFCSLDIEKAYDHVDWSFLQYMLKRMSFGEKWRRWIAECISLAHFSIILNGSPKGFFKSSRGIRQGDPLSPFLFLILGEALSRMLHKGQDAGIVMVSR